MSDLETSKQHAELKDEQLDALQGGRSASSPKSNTPKRRANDQGVGSQFMIGGSNGELG